jgi:hypothetical protein
MKRYFINYMDSDDDEYYCGPLSWVRSEMKQQGLTEAVLTEAEIIRGGEFVFCSDVFEWCEKENCGKWCEQYKPRNGKSGYCSHARAGYEPTEKTKILKLKI